MLAQNATMTIEHWFGVSIDKHTWAHPWSAGPAATIVRRLFGVRPLKAGSTTIAIHPQPPRNMSYGATTVPTLRGTVAVSFKRIESIDSNQATIGFTLNVTVPTSTMADVCLPAALLPLDPVLFLDGVVVASSRPQRSQLCLAGLLGGGSYTVQARARGAHVT